MSPPCCLVGDKLRSILITLLCDTVEYTVLLDLQCLTKELCGLCRMRNLVALCERNQRLLNLITHAYVDACFCCCHNKVSVSKVCHLSTVGQFTGVSQNATGVSPWMNGHNNKCVRRHTPLPEKQPRCRPRNAPPSWVGIDGRYVLLPDTDRLGGFVSVNRKNPIFINVFWLIDRQATCPHPFLGRGLPIWGK